MKKITLSFLTIISVMLFSCSSSNDENQNSNTSCLNPPSWLIGTWVHNYNNGTEQYIDNKVVITDNNIIEYSLGTGGQIISTSDFRSTYCGKEPIITVNETFQNNYYMWSFTQTNGNSSVTLNHFYIKIDANTIELDNFSEIPDNSYVLHKL